MTNRELGDRATVLRREQADVLTRMQHVVDFDEALGLLRREREIPVELRAIDLTLRARNLRAAREQAAESAAARKERNTKLRARIAEIKTELESETDGDVRDRLRREAERLADVVRHA